MTKTIRAYKTVMLWFHRDERTEWREETFKKDEIEVEYDHAIEKTEYPDYMGQRINIYA